MCYPMYTAYMYINIHALLMVGNPIIDLQLRDGLHEPFIMILRMADYLGSAHPTHIYIYNIHIHTLTITVTHEIPAETQPPSNTCASLTLSNFQRFFRRLLQRRGAEGHPPARPGWGIPNSWMWGYHP